MKNWGNQAAMMYAYRDNEWVRNITTFVPPKLLNAYPYRLADDDGQLRRCGDPEVRLACGGGGPVRLPLAPCCLRTAAAPWGSKGLQLARSDGTRAAAVRVASTTSTSAHTHAHAHAQQGGVSGVTGTTTANLPRR